MSDEYKSPTDRRRPWTWAEKEEREAEGTSGPNAPHQMQTRPVSPLPWDTDLDGIVLSGEDVVAACQISDIDSFYIVHAANSYPRLVEAIQRLLAAQPSSVGTTRWAMEKGHRDFARALLIELGETE